MTVGNMEVDKLSQHQILFLKEIQILLQTVFPPVFEVTAFVYNKPAAPQKACQMYVPIKNYQQMLPDLLQNKINRV
jgi:hypothetical protein